MPFSMTGLDQGKYLNTVFGSTRRTGRQEILAVNDERFIATLCTVIPELRQQIALFF